MKELHTRKDAYRNIERPDQQEFLQGIQESDQSMKTLEFLEEKGFISCSKNPVSHNILRIHITESGITYFEDIKAERRNASKETRRYWITTGIAILALVLSLAPLLWQAYTWSYELNRNFGASSFSSCAPVGSPSVEAQPERQEE